MEFILLYGKVLLAMVALYITTALGLALLLPQARKHIRFAATNRSALVRELSFSATTLLIFSAVFTMLVACYNLGYTTIYTGINSYSIVYSVLGFFILLFLHDFYFYWTHRLMHHRRVFRHVHLVHHKSVSPNLFTSLSFHPFEAIIQVLYLPVVVFLVPVYLPVLLVFLYYSTFLVNMAGHCGHEFFSQRFKGTWLGRISNTPSYHEQHHKRGHGNYALYMPLWDNLMSTLSKNQKTNKTKAL